MTERDFSHVPVPEERRYNDRKKLVVDVCYSDGKVTGVANTRDIGMGGLYMTTAAMLDIGTSMVMTISVRGDSFEVSGVVVYSDPGHGVGVRFKDISPQELDRLRGELDFT